MEHFPEGTASERKYGFTRVVALGPLILTSGTTAASGAETPEDAYGQTVTILRRLLPLVERAGGAADTVLRVRIYATNAGDAEEIMRAVSDELNGHAPAMTLIEAGALVSSGALLELELDAYRPDPAASGS